MGQPAGGRVEEATRVMYRPDCGYNLAGLPPAGRCRECGVGYDSSSTVVIFGFGGGSRQSQYNSPPAEWRS